MKNPSRRRKIELRRRRRRRDIKLRSRTAFKHNNRHQASNACIISTLSPRKVHQLSHRAPFNAKRNNYCIVHFSDSFKWRGGWHIIQKRQPESAPLKFQQTSQLSHWARWLFYYPDWITTRLLLITQLPPQRRSREARPLLIILHLLTQREVRPGRNQLFHYYIGVYVYAILRDASSAVSIKWKWSRLGMGKIVDYLPSHHRLYNIYLVWQNYHLDLNPYFSILCNPLTLG